MFLTLKPNVYMVRGKCKACIYDFNTYKLYHLENYVADILSKLINSDELTVEVMDCEDMINEFIMNELLEWSDNKRIDDINELNVKNNKIDFAWIEVTTKCNLFCVHCYDMASPFETHIMEPEVYKKVCNFIKQNEIKRIQFIGGEPLLGGEALKNMIYKIKADVEFIEVFTNATMIDGAWASFFAENNIHVAVSVYSYRADEHDRVTSVKGSHMRTNKGIRYLVEYGVKYRVCNVLIKNIRIGECNTELYKINEQKDVVRMIGRANRHLLSRELLLKKVITRERFSMPLNLKLTRNILSGHNCFGHKLYIATNGDVYPCVMERRWKYGNIDEEYQKTLECVQAQKVEGSKEEIDGCKICEFRYTCFDCRPDSLDNDLFAKPWYCSYHPENGIWEDLNVFVDKLLKNLE